MGFVEQYAPLAAQLSKLRGSLGNDRTGYAVPALTPTDMIGVLGLYARSLIAATERISDRITLSKYVTTDGKSNLPFGGAQQIDAARYIAGVGKAGAPWQRAVNLTGAELVKSRTAVGFQMEPSRITFEPARDPTVIRNDQLELVLFLRQAVADYQRGLDAIVDTSMAYGFTGRSSKDSVTVFMSAIRSLGGDLDVCAENPPTTFGEDVRGALGAAARETGVALEGAAKFAGDAAAKVSNLAGNVAGQFVEGFFSSANLLTLVIAGIVVYKVMP